MGISYVVMAAMRRGESWWCWLSQINRNRLKHARPGQASSTLDSRLTASLPACLLKMKVEILFSKGGSMDGSLRYDSIRFFKSSIAIDDLFRWPAFNVVLLVTCVVYSSGLIIILVQQPVVT